MREVTLGWEPNIVLSGKENIDKALALGRGAVLWIAHFSFNSLASKKAFSAAGFDVYHVSRPEHGFSKTRFGIKVLNQIRVRAELRSLAGRIGIDRTKPVESMQAALKLLRQNSIVSITAGAWEGQLLIVVEIFGTELQLAAGAPRLAYAAGCPLLPVFTIRPANSRQIHVVVGDAAIMKESRDLFVRTAAESFVSETARFAAANPEQWRGWEKLRN
jgi:lauroyl/myristoyl acyltransferase